MGGSLPASDRAAPPPQTAPRTAPHPQEGDRQDRTEVSTSLVTPRLGSGEAGSSSALLGGQTHELGYQLGGC